MSEYEKKLEERITELEQMLEAALQPKSETVTVQKEPLDMSYDGWRLTGLYDIEQHVANNTNAWIIMTVKKKKLFGGFEVREFRVRADGDDYYLGTDVVVNKYDSKIIGNIWIKCFINEYVKKVVSPSGTTTGGLYVTDKWKELK